MGLISRVSSRTYRFYRSNQNFSPNSKKTKLSTTSKKNPKNRKMDMEQFKEKKFWEQAFNEFLGSALWVVFLAQAGGSAYAVGISYVVLRAVFGECHWWSPWTLYRIVDQKMDPVKGVFWIAMQILGAYVAGHVLKCLDMNAFAGLAAAGDWGAWAANIKYLIAVMLVLHFFRMYNDDEQAFDMNRSFFMIFALAIFHWFMGGSNALNFSWQFAVHANIDYCLVNFVVVVVAVAFAYVKYNYILNYVRSTKHYKF